MATITNFPGQHPQLHRFETTQDGLLALYRMEGNGSATTGSPTMTAGSSGSGSVTYPETGRFDQAARLTSVSAGNRAWFTGGTTAGSWGYSNTKTFMLWHKHVSWSMPNVAFVLCNRDSSSGDKFAFQLQSGSSVMRAIITNNAETTQILFNSDTSITDVKDGDWHHYAFVIESNSSFKWYVDGALHDSSSSSLGTTSGWNQPRINTSSYATNDFTDNCFIDEVAIFDYAWSAAELRTFGGGGLV